MCTLLREAFNFPLKNQVFNREVLGDTLNVLTTLVRTLWTPTKLHCQECLNFFMMATKRIQDQAQPALPNCQNCCKQCTSLLHVTIHIILFCKVLFQHTSFSSGSQTDVGSHQDTNSLRYLAVMWLIGTTNLRKHDCIFDASPSSIHFLKFNDPHLIPR